VVICYFLFPWQVMSSSGKRSPPPPSLSSHAFFSFFNFPSAQFFFQVTYFIRSPLLAPRKKERLWYKHYSPPFHALFLYVQNFSSLSLFLEIIFSPFFEYTSLFHFWCITILLFPKRSPSSVPHPDWCFISFLTTGRFVSPPFSQTFFSTSPSPSLPGRISPLFSFL